MTTTCECGTRLPISEGRGRPPAYCSTRCRQRAYRARRAARGPVFPQELTERDRWMRYRLVPRGEKATKEPTQINGRRASSTASRTWSSYADAKASEVGEGLGFALGEGIGVIDLDHAIDGGVIAPWAQDVLDANRGTFTETSQSGEGIHIWGLLPEGRGRVIRDGRNIEIYSAGRFIAMGKPMPGVATKLEPLTVPE